MVKLDQHFWRKHLTRGLCIAVIIKVWMGLQNVIFKKPVFHNNRTDYVLDEIYDMETESFTLINLKNVKFSMRPGQGCSPDEKYVIMALSAPHNTQKRENLRKHVEEHPWIKLVFILGKVAEADRQARLQAEHLVHHDLLQTTVRDSYETLAYKSIAGLIWTNRYCGGANYVMKIDDDVKVDYNLLINKLKAKEHAGKPEPVIQCPSVMRNMRPWRHNHTQTVMGKWSIQWEELPRRVHPDFCPGWLYVTTPQVGLALSVIAAETSEELAGVRKLDDIYVTGHLRERVSWVGLDHLDQGIYGRIWRDFFSNCPFLGIYKSVFLNDIVLQKGSSSVSYIKGGRFFGCAFLEYFIFENLEFIHPALAPETLWDLCAR